MEHDYWNTIVKSKYYISSSGSKSSFVVRIRQCLAHSETAAFSTLLPCTLAWDPFCHRRSHLHRRFPHLNWLTVVYLLKSLPLSFCRTGSPQSGTSNYGTIVLECFYLFNDATGFALNSNSIKCITMFLRNRIKCHQNWALFWILPSWLSNLFIASREKSLDWFGFMDSHVCSILKLNWKILMLDLPLELFVIDVFYKNMCWCYPL